MGSGRHLVLYDGVCGLCDRLLQFLLEHDSQGTFDFASLQSAIGQATVRQWGGDPHELTSFYVVADYRTPEATALTRSAAAVFVAGALGWPWRIGRLLRWLPGPWRDRVYDLIARNRYRIFGRHDRCLAPRPEYRGRFIDQVEGRP